MPRVDVWCMSESPKLALVACAAVNGYLVVDGERCRPAAFVLAGDAAALDAL
jgi:hypothetical protein